MKITRDIIMDLLPIYLSGEAGEDTRALVEAYCEHDAELGNVLKAGGEDPFGKNDTPNPIEEVEMKALRRAKKMLRTRSTVLGLAIFFSLTPFSFVFTNDQGMRWIVLEGPIWYPALYLGFALLSWTTFAIMKHRMLSTGL
ncbi:MAG: hypothetical protein DRJ61_17780 [Acidobacteria bacterium]|nr:MAG: hypothetical protein DRJ61_17780 [Acidobacteriota bacterium]